MRRLRAVPIALALLSGVACALLDRPPGLHPTLDPLWADYQELKAHKALAIAGELRRNQWVAGAAGGLESSAAAEDAALRACHARRAERRMVAPCRLYARGDTILPPSDLLQRGLTRGR